MQCVSSSGAEMAPFISPHHTASFSLSRCSESLSLPRSQPSSQVVVGFARQMGGKTCSLQPWFVLLLTSPCLMAPCTRHDVVTYCGII